MKSRDAIWFAACAAALSMLRCSSDDPAGAPDAGVDAAPTPDATPPIVDAQPEATVDAAIDAPPLLPPTSCLNLAPTCGGNSDCCKYAVAPGGVFNRSNNTDSPANVDAFNLDVYEVSVSRFRVFVEAGKGTQQSPPADGAGAHPKIAGS